MKPSVKKAPRKLARGKASSRDDWRAFDALTDAQVLMAARGDPDARPLSAALLKRMKRPNPKVVRRALGLSQEEFADRFQIPIGTLRDWEQGRVEPDQAARAYLKVISHNPNGVRKALATPQPR
jgi:putative transcriptional regulator